MEDLEGSGSPRLSESAEIHHLRRPEGRIAYDVAGDGPLVVCLPGMGDLAPTTGSWLRRS